MGLLCRLTVAGWRFRCDEVPTLSWSEINNCRFGPSGRSRPSVLRGASELPAYETGYRTAVQNAQVSGLQTPLANRVRWTSGGFGTFKAENKSRADDIFAVVCPENASHLLPSCVMSSLSSGHSAGGLNVFPSTARANTIGSVESLGRDGRGGGVG